MPGYVKCVRMMGGLNDKEINETYVKVESSYILLLEVIRICFLGVIVLSFTTRPLSFQVISQMPYFRRSGGRDHIFVFPR